MRWAAPLLFALLTGCGPECGTYTFKGYTAIERCGDVYGTEGDAYDSPADPDLAWAEIRFGHSGPAAQFNYEHAGEVRAHVRWEDLESGEMLGPEEVWTECHWVDYGQPLNSSDDVEIVEPATEVLLESHGTRFNLDVGDSYVRRISWFITCGGDVIVLDGKDNIELVRGETSSLSPELEAWLEPE